MKKMVKITEIAYEFVHCDSDLKTVLYHLVCSIKEAIKCEAVAIRLEKDRDYPYYVYKGFAEEFIEKESHLLSLDEKGKPIPCEYGCGFLLDCMCGRVINGNIDVTRPFFTHYGTFYSNNTSKLLAETSEKERGGGTRNYCNACGFESVVLIPLVSREERGETIGILQLNDHIPNMFSTELVRSLEMMCDIISSVVRHKKMIENIQKCLPYEEDIPRKTLMICSHCKAIKINNGVWRPIESFVKETSNVLLSHAICESCREDIVDNTFKMSSIEGKIR